MKKNRIILPVLICMLIFAGCTPESNRDRITDDRIEELNNGSKDGDIVTGQQTEYTDPGTLVGIKYESSGGSMEFHSEFSIEANEKEIVRAEYWKDYYFSDEEYEMDEAELEKIDSIGRVAANIGGYDEDKRVVKENVPMDAELWTALTEEMEYLKPQLKEVVPAAHNNDDDEYILDGGDYTNLYLTWEKDGETSTAQYYIMSGKRWSSVHQIFLEMARPVGRDLRRIGETQLVTVFLSTPSYSYQASPVDGSDEYYYFVHGDKAGSDRISNDQWQVIRSFFEAYDVSKYEEGSEDKKHQYILKFRYNDDIYKYYRLDKKDAEELRTFFKGLGY